MCLAQLTQITCLLKPEADWFDIAKIEIKQKLTFTLLLIQKNVLDILKR